MNNQENKFINFSFGEIKNNEMINIYELEEIKPFLKTDKYNFILEENITEEIIELCENKMMTYKPNSNYIIVEGNIKNINNSWKNEEDYYLSENYNDLKNKKQYLCSRIKIYNNKINKPPKLEINTNGIISFDNGRNRFCNFRDLGCKTIPIMINKNNIKIFKKNNWIE
jgi:hypothetical protein